VSMAGKVVQFRLSRELFPEGFLSVNG